MPRVSKVMSVLNDKVKFLALCASFDVEEQVVNGQGYCAFTALVSSITAPKKATKKDVQRALDQYKKLRRNQVRH